MTLPLCVEEEDGTIRTAGLFEVIDWWLEHYEGMEHLTEGGTTTPETWYTINTILRRSFEKIKQSQTKVKP
jgi:hypothetical protein